MYLPTGPWSLLSDREKATLVSIFGVSLLAWTLLFLLFRFLLFPRRSHDFNNRLVSMAHVFAAFALASLAIDFAHPLKNAGGPNTPAEVWTMLISVAYFVYDLVCCLFDVKIDIVILLHHAFTITGYAFGIFGGSSGAELVLCVWLMEISNPFMHARELLKELNVHGIITTINDALFVATFIIARMVVGPFVLYATLMGKSAYGVKIGAVAVQVVSTLWFFKILRFIYFKFILRKKRKDE